MAGVGGQGILSIAAVIGTAAIRQGLFVKQAEVHGMSQRGGAVQSHLRISSEQVYSDLIPKGSCDLILSVEPMEALRYMPFLGPDGWIISNLNPFINIPDYPELEVLYDAYAKVKNSLLIDADGIASGLGSKKASNMVVLGAAASVLEIGYDSLEASIHDIFDRKGQDIVQLNLDALKAGKDAAKAV